MQEQADAAEKTETEATQQKLKNALAGEQQKRDVLARSVSPRGLSRSAERIAALKLFAGTTARVEYIDTNSEARDLARMISELLTSSSWKVVGFLPISQPELPFAEGVGICYDHERDRELLNYRLSDISFLLASYFADDGLRSYSSMYELLHMSPGGISKTQTIVPDFILKVGCKTNYTGDPVSVELLENLLAQDREFYAARRAEILAQYAQAEPNDTEHQ